MNMALNKANIKPQDVDYINAHGTSTMAGDAMEANAVKSLFTDCPNLKMSSTKSAIGHLLGAAGAVEAIFCIKAIENGILPPTLNLENPIDEVAGIVAKRHSMTNGTTASVDNLTFLQGAYQDDTEEFVCHFLFSIRVIVKVLMIY